MRAIIHCAAVVLLAACAGTKRTNAEIKADLEAMFETDQSQRKVMEEVRRRHGSSSPEMTDLWKKQNAIDKTNISRLVEIVELNGWPGLRGVGDRAATSAFLILQHADYALQKKYLPKFRAAVAAGEARPWNLALLEDRVLTREGKKQIYGSQWKDNGKGVMELYPIEDEPNVDKRRQALHMPPIAEEAAGYGVEYRPK
ncbi:MAG: hypothetical protein NDJ72_04230 [Elusimicrobia bacterium]|nr:hypothetical protein [Elusimicrobiota bacterium]